MNLPEPSSSRVPTTAAGGADARLAQALAQARSLPALGCAVRSHAMACWGAAEANLVRARRRASGAWLWETEPPRRLIDAEVALLERALRTRSPARGRLEVGPTLAQPLMETAAGWSGLLLRSPPPVATGRRRRTGWKLALVRIGEALRYVEREAPPSQVLHLDAVERLQHVLYGIADLANSQLDLRKVLADIHRLVGELMVAESFLIVILDDDREHFRFLYFADPRDPSPPPTDTPLRLDDYPHSAALALMRQGRSVRGSCAQVAAELGIPVQAAPGPLAYDWLGVPMLGPEGVCGALVVQCYDADHRLGDRERDLLAFVAQLVQGALERRSVQQRLERKVAERTQALRAEITERERAVRLQRALFRIAELSASSIGLEEFYAAVHAVVGELLYARNFFIALLEDDGERLHFVHQVDETGDYYPPRKLRRGLTEYVLRLGKPVRIADQGVRDLLDSGEVERIGTPAVCWLGVPLRTGEHTVGVVVVQSYTEGVLYTQADQDLLSFVSVHIASGLERKQAQDSLRASNEELKETLQRLRETQHELVSAEKMAALGQLVGGVAHEVNTPLGIAITAASGLVQQSQTLRHRFESGQLQRRELGDYFGFADEALTMIARNLERAAELVRTFKQVAVDRSSDGRRRFDLGGFIGELLPSLELLWKRRRIDLEFRCDRPIEMEGFPGALGQVITNLVQNALMHAFPAERCGHMRLLAEPNGDGRVRIEFSDDGVGIASGDLPRIFEPFFTTRRGHGGTGLGLHIVFNLVTEKLGGSLRAESVEGKGTRFVLELPRSAPGS